MGVLKEAIKDEESLWAHIHLSKSMSLEELTEIIVKWKPKAKRSSEAIANYSVLPGNLKKAYGKSKPRAVAAAKTRSTGQLLKLVRVAWSVSVLGIL